MAVAGAATPCLLVCIREVDGEDIVVILHRENRPIKMTVDKIVCDLGTVETNIETAIQRLGDGDRFYIKSQDRAQICRIGEWESRPIGALRRIKDVAYHV